MLLLPLAKTKKFYLDSDETGLTITETLVGTLAIGVLAAVAISSWQSFIDIRNLNTAQYQVYNAMRQAQSQAVKEKMTWHFSFRKRNDHIVEWAVHPETVNHSNAIWNQLDASVRLDDESNLQQPNTVKQFKFDHQGQVKPPLGRITLSSKSGGKAKRCVIVSTILGSMRMAKEKPKPDEKNRYCY